MNECVMRESHRRSIVKALSWRIIATFITAVAALIITGQIKIAVEIGLIDTIAKFAVYYVHERIWNRLKYGEVPPPEYKI